jgi:hypothetical protein
LESAARQFAALGNKKAAALASQQGPPFPEPLGYLWLWFCQHSMGMAASGMAYPVITWEGLYGWARLMQIDIEPWEVDVLINLSCIRANVHAETILEKRKEAR